jgi:hypothetical protein
MRHKSFHGRHGAILSAKVVHVRIPALGHIPWQKSKTLSWLAFVETGHIAEHHHPPMIGFTLLLPANITCKRDIPDHGSTPGEAAVEIQYPRIGGISCKKLRLEFL